MPTNRLAPTTNSLLKMKKLTFLMVALSMMASSHAQTQRMILGGSDCGEWFQDRSAKTWLAGYVSGVNATGFYKDGTDFIEGISGAQIVLWMDNYCKASPLKTVQEGANQLIRELYTKAKK